MQCIVISELVMIVEGKIFGGVLFIEFPKKPPKYIELGIESPKIVEWSGGA